MTAPARTLPEVPWSRPSIDEDETTSVLDRLRPGWLTHGPKATAFEHAVRDELGVEDAFAHPPARPPST